MKYWSGIAVRRMGKARAFLSNSILLHGGEMFRSGTHDEATCRKFQLSNSEDGVGRIIEGVCSEMSRRSLP